MLFSVASAQMTYAQNNVGIGTTTPDATAVLDLTATDKGILVPRLTTTQKNAIVNPATGLLIFDQTLGTFYYYTGSAWVPFLTSSTGWTTTGNAGLTGGTNFLGTTDAQALVFKTNGTERARFLSTGNFGINTTTPGSPLEVKGNTLLSSSAGVASKLQFQNPAATFTSTFAAGAQLANFDYALPITTPTANQVLGVSSISAPAVTLGWITPMLYDVTAAQSTSATRTNYLFNVAYSGSANDANAAGAVITSAGGATNRTATGLTLTSAATGTGASTGLSVTATGSTGTIRAIDAVGRINTNTGSSYDINGARWLYAGAAGSNNTLVGNTGNTTISGSSNTLTGASAGSILNTGSSNAFFGSLAGSSVQSGSFNLMLGASAGSASTGDSNTFVGYQAGVTTTGANANTTGAKNTFLGAGSGPSTTSQLTNATALGYRAAVGQSNSLVLGSIAGVNSATADASIGIGTTTPAAKLELKNGDVFLTNSTNTADAIRFYEPSGSGTNYTAFRARAQDSNVVYKLPTGDGHANELLATDGAGNMFWTSQLVIGSLNLGPTTTLTFGTDQHNLDLDDTKSIYRMSATANISITGITDGTDGRLIIIVNVSSNQISLEDQATSSADNQFVTGTGSSIKMGQNNAVTLVYDAVSHKWRAISNQH